MKKNSSAFSLLVIPVIFFLLSYYLMSAKGGYYIGGSDDPDYAYLMNALRIATLSEPYLVQHPGTTLEVFMALVMTIKYTLFNLPNTLQTLPLDVIAYPESYLRTINISINVCITLALLWLGILAYRQSQGQWGLAMVLQSFPLLSGIALTHSARVTPESFLILAMALLLCALIPFLLGRDLPTKKIHCLTLGAVLALACVTKITALPLLLFFFVVRGIKNKTIAISAFLFGLLLFTLPIWSRFPFYFSWMKELITHTGHYGGGASGLLDTGAFLENIIALWNAFTPLYGLTGLALLWLGYSRLKFTSDSQRTASESGERWLLILVAIIIVQTVMTGKHFRLHYMLSSLMLMSLLAVILWREISTRLTAKPIFMGVLMVPVLGILLFSAKNAVSGGLWSAMNMKHTMQQAKMDARANLRMMEQKGRGCITILYPHSGIQGAALVFGNFWSRSLFYKEFRELYPNVYVYNLYGDKDEVLFTGFKKGASKRMVLEGIRQRQCFLLRGPAKFSDLQKEKNILQLIPLNKNRQERLYKIVGVNHLVE